MRSAQVTAEVQRYRGGCLPLRLAAEFLTELGGALRDAIDAHPASAFRPLTAATAIHQQADGRFRIHLENRGGAYAVTADHVISAMGARQRRERTLTSPIVPGIDLSAPDRRGKVMLTNEY